MYTCTCTLCLVVLLLLQYDDDVVEEHRRVNELAVEDIAEQAVVINNLSKVSLTNIPY